MRVPLRPPPFGDLVESKKAALSKVLASDFTPTPKGKYLHWDELRHRTPPADLDLEEWWLGVKLARFPLYRVVPLQDSDGVSFKYAMPDPVLDLVHRVDRDASGRIEIGEEILNPHTRDRYVVSSLIEEATTSSQLEGAATTVRRAKEMIRSGEKPRNRSERMVINNYRAMRHILDISDGPLTPEMVYDIHRIVTEETLDDPGDAGRLRSSSLPRHEVAVVDRNDGTTLHVPPSATELPERLERMCRFANAETPEEGFVHPVVRAIILHFWLAYDHPFVDGNGRTARALFYWSMISQGYWLFEYLSISRILRKAPAQYARSFLYTETDDNDLTYFLLHELGVIRAAIEELEAYLARKAAEIRRVEALLRETAELNHRQLALLAHALRHPGARYTIQSHQKSHGVAYATARSDLNDLTDRALLNRRKIGRQFVFTPVDRLDDRLAELG